jgi:hypothetical protein
MYIFSRRKWQAGVCRRLSRDLTIVSYQPDGKSVLMARAPAHEGEHDTISSKSVGYPYARSLHKRKKIIAPVNCITCAAIISR